MLSVLKKKLAQSICASYYLCVESLGVCEKKAQLYLKYRGHILPYDLQNPYIGLVPKDSVTLRVSLALIYNK